MKDRESKLNVSDGEDAGQATEDKAVVEDAAREEADVKKLATDLDDLRQTLLRRQADFDNYRKRIERERSEDGRRATARVIEGLIPVLDGFEHALAAHREAEYENYRKGFELIYKQLMDNVAKLGAKRIDPLGKAFDPHLHQAVETVEAPERREHEIVGELQRGYKLKHRLLRPAVVKVAVAARPGEVSAGGEHDKKIN
jgi:molecular chaperone GrpE